MNQEEIDSFVAARLGWTVTKSMIADARKAWVDDIDEHGAVSKEYLEGQADLITELATKGKTTATKNAVRGAMRAAIKDKIVQNSRSDDYVGEVEPRLTEALDEDGRLWRRQRSGRWNLARPVGDDFTLAYAAEGNGPLRFADEMQA